MKERKTWSWFLTPPPPEKKRGKPRKPLGIVGAAVGFGKGPRIGVVLPCPLWSACICMAGQRPQLTVERVGKKGPASDRTVGFCSSKFAPPSELLLQMGEWVDVDRERGMEGRWRIYVQKISSWNLIICVFLKCTLMKCGVKKKSSKWLSAFIFITRFLNWVLCLKKPLCIVVSPLKCKGWLLD